MLPLEWSMTLWFTAVPQWELEPEPPLDELDEFIADLGGESGAQGAAAAAVDTFAALLAEPMPLWLPKKDDAAAKSPASQAEAMPKSVAAAPAATRLVFKGYQWIPENQWQQIAGRLWHAWVDNARHDALRHRLARPHPGTQEAFAATGGGEASSRRA